MVPEDWGPRLYPNSFPSNSKSHGCSVSSVPQARSQRPSDCQSCQSPPSLLDPSCLSSFSGPTPLSNIAIMAPISPLRILTTPFLYCLTAREKSQNVARLRRIATAKYAHQYVGRYSRDSRLAVVKVKVDDVHAEEGLSSTSVGVIVTRGEMHGSTWGVNRGNFSVVFSLTWCQGPCMCIYSIASAHHSGARRQATKLLSLLSYGCC